MSYPDHGFPLCRRAGYNGLLFDGKVHVLRLVIDDLDDGAAELNKIQLAVNGGGVSERHGPDKHGLLKLIFGHRDGGASDPAENPLRAHTGPVWKLSDSGEDSLIPRAEFAVNIHSSHTARVDWGGAYASSRLSGRAFSSLRISSRLIKFTTLSSMMRAYKNIPNRAPSTKKY